MTYIEIVDLAVGIISGALSLLTLHFVIFTVVGVLFKRKYPVSERKLRYGIAVSARNEATVIGQLIESVRKNDYPQEKLEIFVVAHNCTDRTAEIARAAGATVYEYNNPDECTKGYALKHLFERVKEEHGADAFDGFIILDSDNVLDASYISRMNDAFVACGEKNTITSFRHSKNFGHNTLSAIYGLFWINGCRFEMRGRSVLDCSTRVPGTGFLISREVVRDGWKYVTLTEDWEFSADRVISGEKIYYCDDAVFYDEQPTTLRIMWRQRVRWARGHLLVCVTRFADLLKSLLTPRSKGGSRTKGSVYDIFSNVFPALIVSTVLSIIQLILYLFSPLFGHDLGALILSWLTGAARGFATGYLGMMLLAAFLYILEHRRIRGVSTQKKITSVLLYPLFMNINFFCVIVALFSKNLKWKTIPHNDTTGFGDLNPQ